MFPVTTALIFVLLTLITLTWKVNQRVNNKLPAGPFRLPFIGNFLNLAPVPHLALLKLSRRFNGFFSMKIGVRDVLVLGNYDAIDLLRRYGTKLSDRPCDMLFMDTFNRGGKNLAMANYHEKWRYQRKFLHSQFFSSSALDQSMGGVQKELEHLYNYFEKCAESGEAFCPRRSLKRTTHSVISRLLFNEHVDLDDEEFNHFWDHMEVAFELANSGNLSDWFPSLKLLDQATVTKTERIVKVRDEYIRKRLEECEKTFDETKVRHKCDVMLAKRKDLKDDKKKATYLNKEHMELLFSDLLLAGTDTTATTIENILVCLANHQECQRRVQEEIDDVLGEKEVELSDQSKLPYLDAVINEAMRLIPITPNHVPHVAKEDVTVTYRGNEYMIPGGTVIMTDSLGYHRTPEEFGKSPESFRPERFIEDPSLKKKMMPFGVNGPRICVGKSLSLREIFLITTNLLRRFSITPGNGSSIPVSIESDFKTGIVISLKNFSLKATKRH